MTEWEVNVKAYGWFPVTADTRDEAREKAEAMTAHGVPSVLDLEECEVTSVEESV